MEKKVKTTESDEMIALKQQIQDKIMTCVNNSDVSNEAAMAAIVIASLWNVAKLSETPTYKVAAIIFGRIILEFAQDIDPDEVV